MGNAREAKGAVNVALAGTHFLRSPTYELSARVVVSPGCSLKNHMLSPYFLKAASIVWGKSLPLSTIMPTSFAGNLERANSSKNKKAKKNKTKGCIPVRAVVRPTGETPRFEGEGGRGP